MLPAMQIEYHFDFSCPYAYLGSTQIEAVAARTGAELKWRPMLLGGVFRAVDTPQNMSEGMVPAKARHNALDMMRWADHWNVPLEIPAKHPMRTVRALRALLSLDEARWPAVIHALYRAYWVSGKDFAARETVAAALAEAGIAGEDAERALAANDDQQIKDELRRRTDEAIRRGVFGAPAIFVGEDASSDDAPMFWGQDRLHMVEAVATGWKPGETDPPRHDPAPQSDTPRVVEFWYDFSSPFAYLGSTQIERVAREAGAQLVWRPMLLGALFKTIGTANVPLLNMSEAKRRFYARDLTNWAAYWNVPFQFTTRFPMKTVTALRLALQAGDRIADLSHALFRALWVDNRDINDEATLRELLTANDFDAEALLAGTRDPEIKKRLFDATSEAEASQVFGAPTSVVDGMAFWGQDRLDFVGAVLRGWIPKRG
jgi:2-hydroxychromene-2-carboxylate isomerase